MYSIAQQNYYWMKLNLSPNQLTISIASSVLYVQCLQCHAFVHQNKIITCIFG